MSRVVTLLTDLGTRDSYVAEVKGRLLLLAEGATLVDVTHEVPPGDVAAGAFVLGRAWRAFPPGTVHLAVVDPGVGTARRALAVAAGGHAFTGPDNGLLEAALALPDANAFALPLPPGASSTFHGRDVFAPAAAALAAGSAPAALGAPIADPVRRPFPTPRREAHAVVGEVVYVDRFGTLVTNLDAGHVAGRAVVRLGRHDIPLHATFGDVAPGALVAFIGSGGTLEIALRDGRANEELETTRGAEVRAAIDG